MDLSDASASGARASAPHLGWIDAHNHLHDRRLPRSDEFYGSIWDSGVSACVVNAIDEDDWDQLAALTRRWGPRILPAWGVHPWHAHQVKPGWEARLESRLRTNPKAHVGECGLDGWVDEPSIEVQVPVFKAQLRLAKKLGRSVTIHCLKAWGVLLEVFADEAPPERFLMHSYGGSREFAEQLLKRGAWFSFSGYFLQAQKHRTVEVFRQLPIDRVLLETDAPDMSPPHEFQRFELSDGKNHPGNLGSIGEALARELGMSAEEFAHQLRKNSEEFFAVDFPL